LRFFEFKETLYYLTGYFFASKSEKPSDGRRLRRAPLARDAMFARQARFLLR